MNTKYLEVDKQMSKEIASEFGEGYLPPLPKIEIDKPIALPGMQVLFENPRTIKSEFLTIGKVIHVETHWANESKYEHIYTVKPWAKNYKIKVRNVELYIG